MSRIARQRLRDAAAAQPEIPVEGWPTEVRESAEVVRCTAFRSEASGGPNIGCGPRTIAGEPAVGAVATVSGAEFTNWQTRREAGTQSHGSRTGGTAGRDSRVAE